MSHPAISLWQPWASLIAAGCKPFEFRSWPAPRAFWGTHIAIHAAARPVRRAEVQELLVKLQTARWRETGLTREPALALLERVFQAPKSLPLSAIVCLALLGEPIRNNELSAKLGLPLVNDSERVEHSNWGWPLMEIQPMDPPHRARGAQGFWRWTPEKFDG